MARYRMCFFNDDATKVAPCGPSVGIGALCTETAIRLSEQIWLDIQQEDPARGFVLLDTVTNKRLLKLERIGGTVSPAAVSMLATA